MNTSVNVYGGQLTATGLKIGIVCSRFNEFFVSKLLDGAIDTIVRHGGDAANIDVAWVPGSYEIPLAVQKLADSGRYDALIGIGVVIQGATAHADYINSEVAKGLAQVSMKTGVPIAYGVVTTENIEQAIERSGCKAGNRGADAAITAIEMANLLRLLPKAAAKVVAAPAALPAKRRGRPAKTAIVAPAPAVVPVAVPATRGRPAKKAAPVAVAVPAKRGRPSKKELRARKKADKMASLAAAKAAATIVAKVTKAVAAEKAAKATKAPKTKTAKATKAVNVENVASAAPVSEKV
jgi:6,7-dimethyl-8-ribityllumazine synthase